MNNTHAIFKVENDGSYTPLLTERGLSLNEANRRANGYNQGRDLYVVDNEAPEKPAPKKDSNDLWGFLFFF